MLRCASCVVAVLLAEHDGHQKDEGLRDYLVCCWVQLKKVQVVSTLREVITK